MFVPVAVGSVDYTQRAKIPIAKGVAGPGVLEDSSPGNGVA